MLFAHTVPDDIIIGEGPPVVAHLRCVAQRFRIQKAKDSVREFGRQSSKKVDAYEITDAT